MSAMRVLIALLMVHMALLAAPINAQADDLIVAKAYFVDASASLSFQDLQGKTFTPYEGPFSRGFSSANFWFRLTIDPSRVAAERGVKNTDQVILRIRPPYIREVEFFDPLVPVGRPRLSGDIHPSAEDEYRSFNLAFVLPAGMVPRDVYVRMTTSSSTLIDFGAYAADEINKVDFRQGIFISLLLAFIGSSLLLALLLLTVYRSRLIILYALRQAVAIWWTLAIFGVYRYAEPAYGPPAMHFMVWSLLFISFTSALFDLNLFRSFQVPKTFSRIQLLLMGLSAVAAGLLLSGQIRPAMMVNISMVITFSAVTTVASYFAFPAASAPRSPAELSRSSIAGSYTVIFGALLFTLFPQIGLLAGTEFAVYSLCMHNILSSLLVSVIIGRRAQFNHDQKILLVQELAGTRAALEIETAARQDQSALLGMLSHELKTPLAGMKMALEAVPLRETGYLLMSNAINDINDLIDRCLHMGRVEDGKTVANRSHVDVVDALRERLLAAGLSERVNLVVGQGAITFTDPQLLDIILANLLDNAKKYARPGSIIEADVRSTSDGGMAVTVSNEPRSGAWPDRDQLFRKYYRAATSHAVIGSGLGLFLSQRLAETLGGRIAYEPSETQVRFRLWLPG